MYCQCKARAGRLMMCSAKEVVLLTQARTLASPTMALSRPSNVRPSPDPNRSIVTTTTTNDPLEVEAIFQQKRSLRSKIRKELKNMDPIRRSEEGFKFNYHLCYPNDFELFVSLYVCLCENSYSSVFAIWICFDRIIRKWLYLLCGIGKLKQKNEKD